MKKQTRTALNKEGYALLLSLTLLSLLIMGATLLFRMSSQRVFTVTKQTNFIRAQTIAEAGVHRAYAMLQIDPTLIDQSFNTINIGDGTASISISTNTQGLGNKSLTGIGTFNGETSKVAIVLQASNGTSGTSGPDPKTLELFKGAIFCGGNATLVGNSKIHLYGATAHVNGKLRLTGSSSFENGSLVTSSTELDIAGNIQVNANVVVPVMPKAPWGSLSTFITGTLSIQEVPEQMIEIDLDPYRLYAQATDSPGHNYQQTAWNEHYTDSYFSADEMPNNGKLVVGGMQTLEPDGGVLWVEGSITFNGDSKIKGCIIATGDIKVLGGMTHANPGGLPAFMSLNGNVIIGSGCEAYGLIYSHQGDIKISGDADVYGAFICPRGDFTQNGSGKVYYVNSIPYGPNGEDVMLPKPVGGTVAGLPKHIGWIK